MPLLPQMLNPRSRLDFERGKFESSKWLLRRVPFKCPWGPTTGPVIMLAEALDFDKWTHGRLSKETPDHTPGEAISVTRWVLEFRLSKLARGLPNVSWNDIFAVFGTAIEVVGSRFAQLCLGIYVGDQEYKPETLSGKYLYDGWYFASLGDTETAEQCFEKAIAVVKLRVDPRGGVLQ